VLRISENAYFCLTLCDHRTCTTTIGRASTTSSFTSTATGARRRRPAGTAAPPPPGPGSPASRWDRGTPAARAGGGGRGTGPRGASAAFGRDSLVALLGDAQVVAPVVAMATFHARHARPGVGTYLYELNPGADDRGTYRRMRLYLARSRRYRSNEVAVCQQLLKSYLI